MTFPAFFSGHDGALPTQRPTPTRGELPHPFRPAEPTIFASPATRNRLLGALPAHELAQLLPDLERVELGSRQTLFTAEVAISHVYFPETAVVSLVSRLDDGRTVEVGTAGCEGMAGLSLFLGSERSTTCAFVQVPGTALRLDADVFRRVAEGSGALHRTLLRYTEAYLAQVAQTAACNGAHLVEQRCARWLLMTRDRVEGTEFPLTHELLAMMLGVRRPGVTLAMGALQEAGLVRYARGRVEIVDRAGLERAACECFGVVRAHFTRLLPQQMLA